MKRFHEKALDCYDPVADDVFVDVRLHGIVEDYRIYLENISFSSFFRLMEAVRRTNELV